jgi:glutamine---fructose-6-phosphate transaminase (isomerizing)
MCGIFGYIGNKENAAEIVLEGLKRLEYRGYDSWGVAEVTEKNHLISVKKRVGKIGEANIDDLPASSFAFGHTRWATHGGVTEVNAHPHLDCSGKITLIHNGIFENYEEIKKELIRKGHKILSETDSEVAVHLIEELNKKHLFNEAVRLAFNKMEGLNALVVINSEENSFVAVRSGSPLCIGFGKDANYLASDPIALLIHTKEVYFLEEGEMAVIEKRKVQIFDSKTKKIVNFKTQKLNWTFEQGEKGKFPHFMLKEIYEQPDIILEIASNGFIQAEKAAQIIKDGYGTYLVGCGTASYACLAGSYLFSKIAKKHVNFAVGSEFGYSLDFLTKDSVVLALSQSGETMDILESVKKAKEKKAKILSLVNVLGSSLYRMSDFKMIIGAGPERSVASTKAFTGMVSHLILIAYSLIDESEKGRQILIKAAKNSKQILVSKEVEMIKELAKKIKSKKHLYVIGRGLSYPTSLETALKIKEISYIHAEGLAAGELKHGPLALIEKGTPCICFLPNDETYGANLAGAMEMKARGGFIIGVSFKPHEIFDYYIPVGDAGEATIIPNIVVSQLLAYYLAIELKRDPDKPRNLAKSVTVK